MANEEYTTVRIKRSVYNALERIGKDMKDEVGAELSVPLTIEKLASDKKRKALIPRDESGKFVGGKK